MLIDYLNAHFLTEQDFAAMAGWSPQQLAQAISPRIMPAPSYRTAGALRVRSFLADDELSFDAGYHLKGHLDWARALQRLEIRDEGGARGLFMLRYDAARQAFAMTDLGTALSATAPDVMAAFDGQHAAATWRHFLNGVYGSCTRDGAPETVFFKQVGVMMVEALIATPPEEMPERTQALLYRAVGFLDRVSSDFAPHERATSSRQRCVEDVRKRYFDNAD